MGKVKWSPETALEAFKMILLKYGEDISVAVYDKLDIPNKPATKTLCKFFGTWNETKVKALPDSADSRREYLIKDNRRLLQQVEYYRNLASVFEDTCLAEISKLNIKPVKVPPKSRSKENLEFFALRSDAQVGEKVDPEIVQGLSHYGPDEYKERIGERWVDRMVTFYDQDHTSLGLNKLVINFLGDQVEGERIYKGQAFNIDLDLVRQIFFSIEVECNAILALAKIFNQIEIFCVKGNHGRAGRIGEHHPRTNFDYLFYRILKMTLKPQSNVKVFISESPSMLVQHGSFKFVLNHLDSIRSYMSIPYYGLERQFRMLHDLYGMVIDYELGGHFHEPANIADKIILNGCVPGGSDYSINKMYVSSTPSQKIFYFHPQRGINRESSLILADRIELKPDGHGIFTPHVEGK